MIKRFLLGWVAVYTFNSLSGYLIHDILLHKTYMALMPALHSGDIKNKIWAFAITSVTGSFFYTFIYSAWKKRGTLAEGLKYGFFIGLWMSLDMSLNTYASTGLIPLSLALQWLIYGLVQYSIAGIVVSYVYNYRLRNPIPK
ncbi:MAG TPA: hypothetical protein VFQ86_04500 [Arachidicoccus soli]|nr:hypothetical protein [Arachidicoccus soli]